MLGSTGESTHAVLFHVKSEPREIAKRWSYCGPHSATRNRMDWLQEAGQVNHHEWVTLRAACYRAQLTKSTLPQEGSPAGNSLGPGKGASICSLNILNRLGGLP